MKCYNSCIIEHVILFIAVLDFAYGTGLTGETDIYKKIVYYFVLKVINY